MPPGIGRRLLITLAGAWTLTAWGGAWLVDPPGAELLARPVAVLYRTDGTPADPMPAYEAEERIRAGSVTVPRGTSVLMVSPDGERYDVPAESLHDALGRSHYRLGTLADDGRAASSLPGYGAALTSWIRTAALMWLVPLALAYALARLVRWIWRGA